VQERGKDLSARIEEGLGPNGLGIISISHVSVPPRPPLPQHKVVQFLHPSSSELDFFSNRKIPQLN
jgi:hypothetical protein